MPYISYYENTIPSVIKNKYIIWDRFSEEEEGESKIIFKDKKNSHKRDALSYLKYSSYIYRKLLSHNPPGKSKIVIFGLQITFFLIPYLLTTKNNFVIDMRDYHYLFKLIPMKVFRKASFVAVSSPGYLELFDDSVNCVICHNLYDYNMSEIAFDVGFKYPLSVSYIGAIRDLSSQIDIINSLSNKEDYKVGFHGTGDIVSCLKQYVLKNSISNVYFTGKYSKSDEPFLYKNSDFINLLRDNESYNNRIALPNRLYSAATFYKPTICYNGTALSLIIEKYSLGVCVDSAEQIEEAISNYANNFSYKDFKENCDKFLKDIKLEQKLFSEKLNNFLTL